MFYRLYRPQRFSELVGLDSVKAILLSQVQQKKFAHAYLFAGPKGTGKTTTARILAKALNCQKIGQDGEPDNACENCLSINKGSFLDLIEIDAASNRGIEDIRSLRESVRLSASHGKYKVYIIDESHMLTPEAFNALLKTLEEPPSHVVFILATTESHKLPATIISRCQRFAFERATIAQIVEKLKTICAKEGIKISDEDLGEIAKSAQGGFRDAETLLEQVASSGKTAAEVLGIPADSNLSEFIDLLINHDTKGALLFINNLYGDGVNLEKFNERVLEYIRDLLLVKAGVGEQVLEVGKEVFAKMSEQAQSLQDAEMDLLIEKFTQSLENMSLTTIPPLPLEVAVFEVTKSIGKDTEVGG